MGMYDDIICEYKLPMPEDPKGYSGSPSFQTKDLENSLSVYLIKEDGTIWIETYENEIVPGDPNAKFFLDRIGHVKKNRTGFKQLFDTETIEIYDYRETNEDYDYWILYKLVFVKGVVSEATIVQFEATDNSKRKIKDAEFDEKLRKRSEFTKTLMYRILFHPWNKLVSFIFRRLQKAVQSFGAFCWKAESFLRI
jgi:hypothetical protein